MSEFGYAVDLDLLAETTSDLAACAETFETLLGDLERRVAALHLTWTGEAAVAHRAAHHEWVRGFRAMHEALAQMRRAARVAHDNYAAAVEANVRLWSIP